MVSCFPRLEVSCEQTGVICDFWSVGPLVCEICLRIPLRLEMACVVEQRTVLTSHVLRFNGRNRRFLLARPRRFLLSSDCRARVTRRAFLTTTQRRAFFT